MKDDLAALEYEDLLCLALRHRWVPHEGEAGVVGGARVIRWVLKCETGCGCTAFEWRDLHGNRVPGTQRQYQHTDQYKRSTGYSQGEYFTELLRRERATDAQRAG